ncbi:hypothetical protein ACF09J_21105 [Streptomyces sp. NPDC014889]|uniref:hypothetical protein n=1 Tax=Streptomyces sp. NPDC014889 TaxID=3364928 RepID=UPI0036FA72B3
MLASDSPTASRQTSGAVELYAPTDWFDLVADSDEASARERCADLINRSYPEHDPSLRADLTAALMEWRRILRERGLITYGLVCVPEEDGGPAVWQILASVVEVPTAGTDVNLSEIMVRLLGEELEGRQVYTESYPTRMGLGLGVISQPVMSPEGELTLFPTQEQEMVAETSAVGRIGLAISLSCPPGGGRALLVVGNCLDAEQVVPLAGVVALIAGNSFFAESVEGTTGLEVQDMGQGE